MPQDRSVDVSPFSILPTFYRGVCGCIGARVTYAQAEGPGYNDISRKLRDACYFTLRRIASSLTDKVIMVSHITTVYCRCHPTAEDWGLCQDSECGLGSRGSRRGHLRTNSLCGVRRHSDRPSRLHDDTP